MRYVFLCTLVASPAAAATGPFFSLGNTDFVVTIGFLVFVGVILYFRIPSRLTGLLDDRSRGIRDDLDEAKALREEAQTLLASYDRKIREAKDQAADIVAGAKAEAESASVQARADLEVSVQRRLAAAEDQIDSARNAAVREVRDRAIVVATAVAADVLRKQMTEAEAGRLIDASIETVGAKLH